MPISGRTPAKHRKALRSMVASGSRVRATEVILNTDAAPMPVSGTICRTPFGDGIIEERIVFRGDQSGDASYLGLARSMRRTS